MKTRKKLRRSVFVIRLGCMIRGGFLSAEDRADLIDLALDGSSAHRLGRRANVLLPLDEGWSREQVAKALFLDDGIIRSWIACIKRTAYSAYHGTYRQAFLARSMWNSKKS